MRVSLELVRRTVGQASETLELSSVVRRQSFDKGSVHVNRNDDEEAAGNRTLQ